MRSLVLTSEQVAAEPWFGNSRAQVQATVDRVAELEAELLRAKARCLTCGAPCFVHYCYACGTEDPCAAPSQKTTARLARRVDELEGLLKKIDDRVRSVVAQRAETWANIPTTARESSEAKAAQDFLHAFAGLATEVCGAIKAAGLGH